MLQAYLLFAILLATVIMFVWGYWRFDTIALCSLLTLVLVGIIPASEAFIGFSNPAVITVACVMAITHAISQSGIIDRIVKHITPLTQNQFTHISVLCLITALLSAFMNNVGALALMMPIAIQTAIHNKRSPSLILMPLSFASVLGGLTTEIGTPPNLLLSNYRQELTGQSFTMFDFTPVGLTIAIIGVVFIGTVGWKLIPQRRSASKSTDELYHIQDYITEVIVPEDSPFVGKSRREIENVIEGDFSVIGIIRGRRKHLVIAHNEVFQSKDVLIIEASHDDLHSLLEVGRLQLAGGDIISPERLRGDDIALLEAVVPPGSRIEGRSWQKMRIRSRFRINLLAIARSGSAFKNRLNHVDLHGGDVLLLQGDAELLRETVVTLGLVPLAERNINVGFRRKMLLPLSIFLVAIVLAAMQVLTVTIAFVVATVMMVIINVIPMRRIYQSIDWSIITLLAAMIPIGGALQTTGATQLITDSLLHIAGADAPLIIITILLLVTMSLSDVMNNAATAVVMAPIASNIAESMSMSLDPFLMAVAVGASCSFLTPISHQNNTLVMGPGGYKFYDYLRLGIPLEILVLVIAVPLINYFWL